MRQRLRTCRDAMVVLIMRLQRFMLRGRTLSRWTCHLCGVTGRGDIQEFYRHFDEYHA